MSTQLMEQSEHKLLCELILDIEDVKDTSTSKLKMRDLIFKNLTSNDKKRRIIASSESIDKQGIRSIIRRHFVCIVKEVKGGPAERPLPYLYVLKERNSKERKENFFCRIKGSVYAVSGGRLLLILFMHSLRINLAAIPEDSIKYSA